eukprot:548145_1
MVTLALVSWLIISVKSDAWEGQCVAGKKDTAFCSQDEYQGYPLKCPKGKCIWVVEADEYQQAKKEFRKNGEFAALYKGECEKDRTPQEQCSRFKLPDICNATGCRWSDDLETKRVAERYKINSKPQQFRFVKLKTNTFDEANDLYPAVIASPEDLQLLKDQVKQLQPFELPPNIVVWTGWFADISKGVAKWFYRDPWDVQTPANGRPIAHVKPGDVEIWDTDDDVLALFDKRIIGNFDAKPYKKQNQYEGLLSQLSRGYKADGKVALALVNDEFSLIPVVYDGTDEKFEFYVVHYSLVERARVVLSDRSAHAVPKLVTGLYHPSHNAFDNYFSLRATISRDLSSKEEQNLHPWKVVDITNSKLTILPFYGGSDVSIVGVFDWDSHTIELSDGKSSMGKFALIPYSTQYVVLKRLQSPSDNLMYVVYWRTQREGHCSMHSVNAIMQYDAYSYRDYTMLGEASHAGGSCPLDKIAQCTMKTARASHNSGCVQGGQICRGGFSRCVQSVGVYKDNYQMLPQVLTFKNNIDAAKKQDILKIFGQQVDESIRLYTYVVGYIFHVPGHALAFRNIAFGKDSILFNLNSGNKEGPKAMKTEEAMLEFVMNVYEWKKEQQEPEKNIAVSFVVAVKPEPILPNKIIPIIQDVIPRIGAIGTETEKLTKPIKSKQASIVGYVNWYGIDNDYNKQNQLLQTHFDDNLVGILVIIICILLFTTCAFALGVIGGTVCAILALHKQ